VRRCLNVSSLRRDSVSSRWPHSLPCGLLHGRARTDLNDVSAAILIAAVMRFASPFDLMLLERRRLTLRPDGLTRKQPNEAPAPARRVLRYRAGGVRESPGLKEVRRATEVGQI
jgi:hypothetical protein